MKYRPNSFFFVLLGAFIKLIRITLVDFLTLVKKWPAIVAGGLGGWLENLVL